ncbi:hypothetical protein LPC_1565 [Legionella pneumophila str. Corby]|nr:hypothetical protein LPC_1565 [Legionella pneumophila str. Corby]
MMMPCAGEGWGEGNGKIFAKTTSSRFTEKQYQYLGSVGISPAAYVPRLVRGIQ